MSEEGLPKLEDLEDRIRREILLAYEEKVRKLKAEYERFVSEIEEKYDNAAREFARRAAP
ncbi:MAG: hypothetical protein LRS46_02890 [Desulfurococcales archaeon]|nr:hypothetical protein [Desulfurococcales archaeon]